MPAGCRARIGLTVFLSVVTGTAAFGQTERAGFLGPGAPHMDEHRALPPGGQLEESDDLEPNGTGRVFEPDADPEGTGREAPFEKGHLPGELLVGGGVVGRGGPPPGHRSRRRVPWGSS